MARNPVHPACNEVELPAVLDCLSDPTRLAIVYTLAKHEHSDRLLCCGDFDAFGRKSNLTYHFSRLREAGILHTRVVKTTRYMQLRRKELNARFPGLLDAVLISVQHDADRLQIPDVALALAES